MKAEIAPKWFSVVMADLIASESRSVTKYLTPKLVVRATYTFRPNKQHTREEVRVSFGVPNYLEQRFINMCVEAGEKFPVRRTQIKPWPVKRVKKEGV